MFVFLFFPSYSRCDLDRFHRRVDAPCHVHVQDYGAYLEADAIAAAASCREMEWALQEAFRLAEQCSDYKLNERYSLFTIHYKCVM